MKAWLKGLIISLVFVLIYSFITNILNSNIPDFGDFIQFTFSIFFIIPLVFGIIVGFLYGRLFNEKRKTWLKGTVIGMIIGAIFSLFIYFVWLFIDLQTCGDEVACGLAPGLIFIFSVLPIIIASGIIGGFIGKIKSRK